MGSPAANCRLEWVWKFPGQKTNASGTDRGVWVSLIQKVIGVILISLAKAIREQNYYAVLLEFLIVIAGVVIGFQITAWNANRERVEYQQIYLHRLSADVDQMLVQSRGTSEELQRQLQSLLIHHRALNTCVLEETDRSEFDRAIILHQVLPSLSVVRATYDEMVSAGALAQVEDDALKAAISEFFSATESMQSTIEYFRSDLGRGSAMIMAEVEIVSSIGNTTTVDELIQPEFETTWLMPVYDFGALCRNSMFKTGMTEALDSAVDRIGIERRFQNQLIGLQDQLARVES